MIKYKLGIFIRVTQEKEFFMSSQKLYRLVVAALLCAVGILIPMFSPIKITIEPASFTLASHVAIFLAMFVSPSIAVAVSVGTTLGFFLANHCCHACRKPYRVCAPWLSLHPKASRNRATPFQACKSTLQLSHRYPARSMRGFNHTALLFWRFHGIL